MNDTATNNLTFTPTQKWHHGHAAAGERKLHATLPFLAGAGCLALMGAFLDSNPAAGFAALLGATVMWGPAGIIYGLPATFLQVRTFPNMCVANHHEPCSPPLRSSWHACQSNLVPDSAGKPAAWPILPALGALKCNTGILV